jgi:hypothetical protein
MAKSPRARAAAAATKAPPKRSKLRSLLVWVVAPIMAVMFHLELLLLTVALLPTIVAWLSDTGPINQRKHYAAKTVGAMNAIGALWPLSTLHSLGGDWAALYEVAADPMSWLACLAAAAVGWVIHFSTPPLVGSYFRVSQDVRRQALKQGHERLLKEWGTEVRRAAPAELPFEESPKDKTETEGSEDEKPFEPDEAVDRGADAGRRAEPDPVQPAGRVRRVGAGGGGAAS